MFKYVFIPADIVKDVEQRIASKDGGLEKDELRYAAENYFQKSCQDDEGIKRGSNVEIITVCVANEANQFQSVSMYADANTSSTDPINERATTILNKCGHDSAVVKGDVFLGRAFDDEREEWMRLDFLLSELNTDENSPTSGWIQQAKKINTGRNMSAYRTSGAMKQVMQQQPQTQLKELLSSASNTNSTISSNTGYLSWNETNDEIELRFKLPNEYTAKLLNIIITSNTLHISPKSPQQPLSDIGEIFQNKNGATLYGKIIKDESTWSITTENDGMKVLTFSLAKSNSTLKWNKLLQQQ